MKTISSKKPEVIENRGDGSLAYHWNIEEITVEGAKQWQCDECIVWQTVTKDKLTQSVINEVYPITKELKFVNDYNAAKEGVYTGTEASEKIAAYKDFLSERKALKEQINSDCAELGII